jgi:hypothetical protein
MSHRQDIHLKSQRDEEFIMSKYCIVCEARYGTPHLSTCPRYIKDIDQEHVKQVQAEEEFAKICSDAENEKVQREASSELEIHALKTEIAKLNEQKDLGFTLGFEGGLLVAIELAEQNKYKGSAIGWNEAIDSVIKHLFIAINELKGV